MKPEEAEQSLGFGFSKAIARSFEDVPNLKVSSRAAVPLATGATWKAQKVLGATDSARALTRGRRDSPGAAVDVGYALETRRSEAAPGSGGERDRRSSGAPACGSSRGDGCIGISHWDIFRSSLSGRIMRIS